MQTAVAGVIPPVPSGERFTGDARPVMEERRLVERLRAGDELAFARLYEQHWDGVARLLVRLLGDGDEACDVAQEVFVQLFRRPPEPEVPLRAWLFRVAVNRGYNALRTQRRRRQREDAVSRDATGGVALITGDRSGDRSLEEANQAEERDTVRRVLRELPERQRECLVLRAEGLSYAEIAAALGVAAGSVGTLLARAERAFKGSYLAHRGGL